MTEHYDVIIIGSGAGGGTLLSLLAPSGKRVLVLERGEFLPRERENWSSRAVFLEDRYHTSEVWLDKHEKDLHPQTGYWVGGNTKVYGAALFRLRAKDFDEFHLADGSLSPAWPISYADLEPYYARAEALYSVHGRAGDDPTEAFRSAPFPHPPVSDEPRIAELRGALRAQGLRPFFMPLAIRLDEKNRRDSPCIRCATCDGFPCLVDAKGDADLSCVRPALDHANVTLRTSAKVIRLETSASGREITGVVYETPEGEVTAQAHVVVLSAGAVNSAALLLASANEAHPEGLANASGLVGRNFLKHHSAVMVAMGKSANPTIFQKTLAVNDFYWGEPDFPHPMGHAQLLGKTDANMLSAHAPVPAPDVALHAMATHSLDWWLMSEDPPVPENRVRFVNGRIVLEWEPRATEGFDRLVTRWKEVLKTTEKSGEHTVHLRQVVPLAGVGHQAGTCRFGTDPASSVLDVNCRAHGIDNLYVVDGSFFPSSGAVNPSLTIMANALRVGEHLFERLR